MNLEMAKLVIHIKYHKIHAKKGFIDVNYISAKIRFVYKSKRGTMYSFILKLQSLVHHEGSRYYIRPCCLFLSLSYNSRLVKRVRLESN